MQSKKETTIHKKDENNINFKVGQNLSLNETTKFKVAFCVDRSYRQSRVNEVEKAGLLKIGGTGGE